MREGWSSLEQRKAVEAYLAMLEKQKRGEAYNKAAINRQLGEGALAARSRSAIEYRMQNISAVLDEMGWAYISGYKPARNVGQRVREELKDLLAELMADSTEDLIDTNGFEANVRQIRQRPMLTEPTGTQAPARRSAETTTYVRDPYVKAWVLENARGLCEGCGQPAPFTNEFGEPYLEVHHMRPLAAGGSDTIQNAVALCPNCHRRCHYGEDRVYLAQRIYTLVSRLVAE